MLHFLKNLRSQDFFKGRFSKYLLYAIGEVTLVVIGILIAVRIDNWNEGRKKDEAFYDILTTVARDLKEDVFQYEYLTSAHERKDSILLRVISGQLKESDYRENWKALRSQITSMVSFYVHQIGFQALQQNLENTPENMRQLVDELTDYYLYKAEGVVATLEREDRFVWKTLEEWESKYSWYASLPLDTGINQERLNYLVNSQEYKNKATTFLINGRNVLGVLTDGRVQGLELFKKIRSFNSKRDSVLIEIAEILDIQDTLKIDTCRKYDPRAEVKTTIEKKSVIIVKNNLGEKIKLYDASRDEKPNDDDYIAEVNSEDFVTIEVVNNQWLEVRGESGKCIGAFKTKSRHALAEIGLMP